MFCVIWFGLIVLWLSLLGPTMRIFDYSLVDTAWETRSPSFPDYTRLVALSDLGLSLFGSAGIALGITNIAYNIYYHKKFIKGFIFGLLVGIMLIATAM